METDGFVPGQTVQVNETGRLLNDAQITAGDGTTTLTLPSGTRMLDNENNPLTRITAEPAADPPSPPPSGAMVLAYDFGPDGATFNPALTLTMQYDPDNLPEGTSPEDLFIAYYDEELGVWVELPTVVDPDTNTLKAQISHFSLYSIIARTPASEPTQPAPTEPEPNEPEPTEPAPTEPEPTEPEPTGSAPDGDDSNGFPWYWIVIGIVAVIAAVLVIMVVRRRSA